MISLSVQSDRKEQIVNITEELRKMVSALGIASGLAVVSVPHTTAGVFISEDDAELREDLLSVARGLLSQVRPFKHRKNNNPNAEAHIVSSLLGSRVVIPVLANELHMGAYQNILFLELDGPKKRSVEVFVYSFPPETAKPAGAGGA
jgi:secondary thiamine-phosphate synthase enzyme